MAPAGPTLPRLSGQSGHLAGTETSIQHMSRAPGVPAADHSACPLCGGHVHLKEQLLVPICEALFNMDTVFCLPGFFLRAGAGLDQELRGVEQALVFLRSRVCPFAFGHFHFTFVAVTDQALSGQAGRRADARLAKHTGILCKCILPLQPLSL